MSPKAAQGDLLYVTGSIAGNVYVYSYPLGPNPSPVGTISGLDFPAGACADAKGDIWVAVLSSYTLVEYAHGGTTPIATLSDPEEPVGCSVDPTTGNLAVTNYGNASGGNSDLVIYQNAQGTPVTYSDPSMLHYYFCGYDNNGNLFVDGFSTGVPRAFLLAELPKGSSTFLNLNLAGGTINFPGGVQWVHGDVAVGDQKYEGKSTSGIYEISVSGSTAQIVGTTPLHKSDDIVQFTIQGHTVIGPDIGSVELRLYRYPRGGAPTQVVTWPARSFYPYGSAISAAK